MTMVSLEMLGVRERFTSFPEDIDVEAVAAIEIGDEAVLTLWGDLTDAVRADGPAELVEPVEAVVERGRRGLGLPADYRRRASSRPTPEDTGTAPARANPAEIVSELTAERDALAARLDAVVGSRSWRWTEPLRAAARRVRAGPMR